MAKIWLHYIQHKLCYNNMGAAWMHMFDFEKQRLCAVSEKLTFLSHWKHIVLLLLWLYTNNTRPFAVSNDALFVCVRSKMMQYL